METLTIENQTQTKLEDCFDKDEIAMISIDNTETFENNELNELYVNEGEKVAVETKKIMETCKYYGITMINVLEEHPLGHVSLAANYKEKKPFDIITFEEIENRTEENNGLVDRAEFTLLELKKFLFEVKSQILRPDHGIQGTQGVKLNEPLNESDFDLKIIKGNNPAREAYSGFDETTLDEKLNKMGKKILLLSGVATDYCVGKTALDAKRKGYEVYLINEAIRGVNPETTDKMINKLEMNGVRFLSALELFDILEKKFTN